MASQSAGPFVPVDRSCWDGGQLAARQGTELPERFSAEHVQLPETTRWEDSHRLLIPRGSACKEANKQGECRPKPDTRYELPQEQTGAGAFLQGPARDIGISGRPKSTPDHGDFLFGSGGCARRGGVLEMGRIQGYMGPRQQHLPGPPLLRGASPERGRSSGMLGLQGESCPGNPFVAHLVSRSGSRCLGVPRARSGA